VIGSGLLAQAGGGPDFADPFGLGVAGVILALCLRLLWVFIMDLRERSNRLEQALEAQREATLAYAEAMAEMKSLGRLLRRVLEALPQVDETPPPRSQTRGHGP
jgi:hypothetical protein